MNEKMNQAFNEQLNAELYSAYLYLSMSAWFDARNLSGFAHWMQIQVQEELSHAQKTYGHLVARGGQIPLEAIDAPPNQWESPLAVFEATYEHECKVSQRIHKLMDLSQAESDYPSRGLLQWFIDEQIEEEATADGIVQKLKLIEGNPQGLFFLDKELAARVFTPPAGKDQL